MEVRPGSLRWEATPAPTAKRARAALLYNGKRGLRPLGKRGLVSRSVTMAVCSRSGHLWVRVAKSGAANLPRRRIRRFSCSLAPKYWNVTRARLVESDLAPPVGHITVPPS